MSHVNPLEVCMTDLSKSLTKEGFTNICKRYGKVKKVKVHTNRAFIEFEDEQSMFDMVNKKGELPDFLEIDFLNQTEICIDSNTNDNNGESKLAAIPENKAISDRSSTSIGNPLEIVITDSSKLLTKEGFKNLCTDYGDVKKIEVHRNQAFIEFYHEKAVDCIINKGDLPAFVDVKLSNKSKTNYVDESNEDNEDHDKEYKSTAVPENECFSDGLSQITSIQEPTYFGFKVSESCLIKDSKQFKSKNSIKKCYHLNNDDLFGRPFNEKWENIKKLDFVLHSNGFYQKFENCKSGKIRVSKKLSPNMFVGQTVTDNDEPVLDILKNMSTKIEGSELLNINDLRRGMLVGAFDNATKLFGRGYVTLVAGNSANVALSDFGRVIKTTQIKVLPESVTQKPAYSFKGYTKDGIVQHLTEEKSYSFTAHKISAERIVFSMMSDSGKSFKVQIKHWEPTVEESGVPYVNFRSGNLVELLKVNSMDSVFIRSREKQHLNIFFSAWNSVAIHCYENCEFMKREPAYGEIIGYKSPKSNNYVRGRIHKYLGDNVYSVKQMHDPIKENVKLSEMIVLTYEDKCMPMSFINVGLNNALPYPIQFEAKQFIDLMKGVALIACFNESKPKGWKTVDLSIKTLNENLNAILIGLVEPLWSKETRLDDFIDEAEDYCTYGNLLTKELKENSTVTMTFVMYYEGVFYMRDKNFGKSFSHLCSMIKEYCVMYLSPYLPHVVGEVCLGQFKDGKWYRVFCNLVKPGHLSQVYSIDTGNVAFLDTAHLRKFPRELLFEPAHVYPCYLDMSSNDKLKFDKDKWELLLASENTDCVEFTVVKKVGDNNEYLIKCPFIENIFK